MRSRFKFSLLGLLVVLVLSVSVEASVPIMPMSELREGMWGTAKTVVRGTEIEEFNVEILGVLPRPSGPVKNLILVRVSGPLIDKTGGIAQGMSGSPVMVNGKLVGAVAYGWGFSDSRLGLLTPAEDMVKLWDLVHDPLPQRETINIDSWQEVLTPEDAEANRWNELRENGFPEEAHQKVEKTSSTQGELDSNKQSEPISLPVISEPAGGIQPLATPLLVSGLSPKAMEMLGKKLEPFNLIPYEAGGNSGNGVFGTIEPGSAVGAQFVRGDISMGALGTVTWVDGNNVIAFGHPFLHKGQSEYIMTNANVVGVIPSLNSAFKLGVIGDPVGLIDQDRSAGISGKMNVLPKTTKVKMSVVDNRDQVKNTLDFEVIQNEKLSPMLIPVSIYSGVDQIMDRSDGGTVMIQMLLKGKSLPGGQFFRKGSYYSSKDASAAAIAELDFLLNFLALNPFEKVDLDEIEVRINTVPERKVGQIMNAATAATEVMPGETIEIEVEIQPYREPRRVEKINYTVPSYASAGEWVLVIRGGASYVSTDELPSEVIWQMYYMQKNKWLAPQTLKDWLMTYHSLDHSQELIIDGYFIPKKSDLKRQQKSFEAMAKAEKWTPLEKRSVGTTEELLMYERSLQSRTNQPWIMVGDSALKIKVKEAPQEKESRRESDK